MKYAVTPLVLTPFVPFRSRSRVASRSAGPPPGFGGSGVRGANDTTNDTTTDTTTDTTNDTTNDKDTEYLLTMITIMSFIRILTQMIMT